MIQHHVSCSLAAAQSPGCNCSPSLTACSRKFSSSASGWGVYFCCASSLRCCEERDELNTSAENTGSSSRMCSLQAAQSVHSSAEKHCCAVLYLQCCVRSQSPTLHHRSIPCVQKPKLLLQLEQDWAIPDKLSEPAFSHDFTVRLQQAAHSFQV